MTGFTIEKNVSMMPRKSWNADGLFGTLRQMQPSESVFCRDFTHARTAGTIGYARKKLPGVKFSARKVEGGVRIWRIA